MPTQIYSLPVTPQRLLALHNENVPCSHANKIFEGSLRPKNWEYSSMTSFYFLETAACLARNAGLLLLVSRKVMIEFKILGNL